MKTSLATQKVMLREIAQIKCVVNENSRRLASITSERGVSLDLPVTLPVSTEEDLAFFVSWLRDDKERVMDLVSYVLCMTSIKLHSSSVN